MSGGAVDSAGVAAQWDFETGSFRFHRATPAGEGGVAVFELYGKGAAAAIQAIFRPRCGRLPEEGRTRVGDLLDLTGECVDEAVVACVPAGALWSGMEAWTLSVHGGYWIQTMVGELLRSIGGVEASLRDVLELSMERGVLDAPRAAAYEFLVDARTERAARFFLRQYQGELSEGLREAMALVDGGRVDLVVELIASLLGASRQALRLGHPLRLLIAGRPNAGKSTLFNRLAEEERSVVTAVPGTTRDLLEAQIALEDYPVIVADSAGIRPFDSVGPVERQGILMVSPTAFDGVLYLIPCPWEWMREDREFLDLVPAAHRLVIASLADLDSGSARRPQADALISARTGEGLDAMRRTIVARWIDDRERPFDELPCAVFTPELVKILSEVVPTAGGAAANLDVVRVALVESLNSSWPVHQVT